MPRILYFFVLLALLFWLMPMVSIGSWLHPRRWEILIFFAGIAYFNHLLMQRGMANNREKFVQMFMVSAFTRLLLSIFFVGYFVWKREAGAYLLIANFFVLYLLCMSFEIYELYRNLRRFS